MKKFNQKTLFILVAIFLLFISFFVWSVVYDLEQKDNLTITFLDVGQGDAIFIESPNGVQVLIDGGPSGSMVLRELSKVIPFYDRSIDMIVMTHPDSDHISGLIDVLKRYKVDYILRPGITHDTPAIDTLIKEIEVEKTKSLAKEIFARRGQVFDLGQGDAGGIGLHILFPDRDVKEVESNTGSIVTRLIYGDTSVMLTGDSPKSIEKYLVSLDGKALRSDILKLGHHGSKTSTTESFLGYVNPQWAIVSAGIDNKYDHPHKSVIDMVKGFDIKIKNTAESGSISFVSNGRQWSLR